MSDTDVPEIDIATLAELHGGVPVVDVRNPDEYETAHVPGAVLIPLAELPDRVGDVPADGTVYIVCAVGGRSHKAAAFLRSHGIDAVNVAGGTKAWVAAGQPTRPGGEP